MKPEFEEFGEGIGRKGLWNKGKGTGFHSAAAAAASMHSVGKVHEYFAREMETNEMARTANATLLKHLRNKPGIHIHLGRVFFRKGVQS